MDIPLVLLRLMHIVAAFLWFGMGVTMFFFVAPAIRQAGPGGLSVTRALYTGTRFTTSIALAGLITTIAGVLMYLFANSYSHFTQTGNIALGIGAIAGILAFLHGTFGIGKITREMAALVTSVPANAPPSAEQVSQLQALGARMGSSQRISFILMLVALIGMGTARYL